MAWIISNYSKEFDIICDPFMGSGSTCIACKKLSRNYIGIEKDEDYFNISKVRLDECQETLF